MAATRRPLVTWLVCALLLGCTDGGAGREERPAGAPVRVVTSTSIYASLVRLIGGPAVQVEAIVDVASVDPHELTLSASSATKVRRADLVLVNGGHYDEPVVEAAGSVRGDRRIVAVATSGLPGADRAEEEGGGFNEHVWYSAPAVRRVAATLTEALVQLAPAQAGAIRSAGADVDRRLGVVVERIAAARERIVAAGARAAVTEPVADHLLGDLGFVIATPPAFSEAVEEGEDPAAGDLKAALDLIRSKAVRVLVYNAQTTSPVTEQVLEEARRSGVPIVRGHEVLPDGTPDLVSLLEAQVSELVAAAGA